MAPWRTSRRAETNTRIIRCRRCRRSSRCRGPAATAGGWHRAALAGRHALAQRRDVVLKGERGHLAIEGRRGERDGGAEIVDQRQQRVGAQFRPATALAPTRSGKYSSPPSPKVKASGGVPQKMSSGPGLMTWRGNRSHMASNIAVEMHAAFGALVVPLVKAIRHTRRRRRCCRPEILRLG